MADKTNIHLWDGTQWVPALCNAAGKLIIDPSEILEDTPTDGEVAKAPTSNWGYDHEHNPSAHHAKYTDAEARNAASRSGSYIGSDTANRAIPHGLGVIPKWVFILTSSFGTQVILYAIVPAEGAPAANYVRAIGPGTELAVTVMDATNFYVGNATSYRNSANENTAIYTWIAYG